MTWLDENRLALQARHRQDDAGVDPVWRQRAWDRLQRDGFPNLKQERWRFTDVSKVVEGPWRLATAGAPTADILKSWLERSAGAYRLVFLNGQYAPQHSLLPCESGLRLLPLSMAMHQDPWRALLNVQDRLWQDNPFANLNLAFLEDGAVLQMPDGLALKKPLYLIHHISATDGAVVHPHHMLLTGDRSDVRIIEVYLGRDDGRYFINPVTRIHLGAGSRVEHYRLQHGGLKAQHIGITSVHQKEGSRYAGHAIDFGGALVRHDLSVELDGEACETYLGGLYVLQGKQHLDHHTILYHQKQRTFSRQLYKGVLKDQSHAVFNGRIKVAREAQHTDAIQHNKNLLLSDGALVDTQPQLEIYADDVRCTHGGTIGQLDEEGLFYLRSRGLDEEGARRLMVQAFVGEMFGAMKTDEMKVEVERHAGELIGWEQ